MNNADEELESVEQPANEVIDRLSFTIQRQSAMCMEFVQHAVEVERRQCAELAEAEARGADSQAAEAGTHVASRIAEKIRARADAPSAVGPVKVRTAR